jgi:hypothetical protein
MIFVIILFPISIKIGKICAEKFYKMVNTKQTIELKEPLRESLYRIIDIDEL